MKKNIEVCKLEHTPFLIMSYDRKAFAVGRSDTKEVLSIGAFNKFFADQFDDDDFLFLQIKTDGSAEEVYPPESMNDSAAFIGLSNDKAIVGAKVGSYWVTPHGFEDWAKKVFKETSL